MSSVLANQIESENYGERKIRKILTSAFLRNELLIDRPHLVLIDRETGPDRMDRPGLFSLLLYMVGNSEP